MSINLEILSSAYLLGEPTLETLNTASIVPNMLMRRRLTRASKIAIELISKLNIQEQYRLICGSAYGELGPSASILNALKDNSSPSPTDFQNSVYSTPASYVSLLWKNQNEILTLSSGDNTSSAILKVGAIKALDEDFLALVCFEALNIPKIEEVNHCLTCLECGVGLLVKHTTQKENIQMEKSHIKGIPPSISHMLHIANQAQITPNPIVKIPL